MSTITVTNIQATGETASRAVSGVAAAWVNFNGTGTIAIRDSVNVGSITDNGTGDYTVNFSNNMGSANYGATLAGGGMFSSAGSQGYANLGGTGATYSTSAVEICTFRHDADAIIDASKVCAAINGDLA